VAQFKLGSVVTEARGKLGGQSLQMQGGRCFLLKSAKPRPSTWPSTSAYKRDQVRLLFEWRNLTAANKLAWNNFANTEFAKSFYPGSETWSGCNWFLSCNMKRFIYYNRVLLLTPVIPTSRPINVFITNAVFATGSGAKYIYFAGAIPAGYTFIIFATRGMSAGRKPAKGDLRLVYPGTSASPFQIAAQYHQRFSQFNKSGMAVHLKGFLLHQASGLTYTESFFKLITS
jgi:hypothetical protein